jgi:hypothetical protein
MPQSGPLLTEAQWKKIAPLLPERKRPNLLSITHKWRAAPVRAVADLALRRELGLQERHGRVVNCRYDEAAGVATLTWG